MHRLVEDYTAKLDIAKDSSWWTDQLITTHALLSSKTCTVPPTSGLWNLPDLHDHPRDFDDSGRCWHGRGYKDCNRDIHIVFQGCKWWHFFPDQDFSEHLAKFYELTNHTIHLDIQVLTK